MPEPIQIVNLKKRSAALRAAKLQVTDYIKKVAYQYLREIPKGEFHGGPCVKVAEFSEPFSFDGLGELEVECYDFTHIDDKGCLVFCLERFSITYQSTDFVIALHEHVEKYGFKPSEEKQ